MNKIILTSLIVGIFSINSSFAAKPATGGGGKPAPGPVTYSLNLTSIQSSPNANPVGTADNALTIQKTDSTGKVRTLAITSLETATFTTSGSGLVPQITANSPFYIKGRSAGTYNYTVSGNDAGTPFSFSAPITVTEGTASKLASPDENKTYNVPIGGTQSFSAKVTDFYDNAISVTDATQFTFAVVSGIGTFGTKTIAAGSVTSILTAPEPGTIQVSITHSAIINKTINATVNVAPCATGTHFENGSCVSDKKICPINDETGVQVGSGEQLWSSTTSAYGTCTVKTCNSGYEIDSVNNICKKIECPEGNHAENGSCVSDIKSCPITNGTGTTTWDSTNSTWGACTVVSCSSGYEMNTTNNTCNKPPLVCPAGQHEENGICVSDTKTCPVTNGSGEQTWNTTTSTYGSCSVKTCNSGYTVDSITNSCVESSTSTKFSIEHVIDRENSTEDLSKYGNILKTVNDIWVTFEKGVVNFRNLSVYYTDAALINATKTASNSLKDPRYSMSFFPTKAILVDWETMVLTEFLYPAEYTSGAVFKEVVTLGSKKALLVGFPDSTSPNGIGYYSLILDGVGSIRLKERVATFGASIVGGSDSIIYGSEDGRVYKISSTLTETLLLENMWMSQHIKGNTSEFYVIAGPNPHTYDTSGAMIGYGLNPITKFSLSGNTLTYTHLSQEGTMGMRNSFYPYYHVYKDSSGNSYTSDYKNFNILTGTVVHSISDTPIISNSSEEVLSISRDIGGIQTNAFIKRDKATNAVSVLSLDYRAVFMGKGTNSEKGGAGVKRADGYYFYCIDIRKIDGINLLKWGICKINLEFTSLTMPLTFPQPAVQPHDVVGASGVLVYSEQNKLKLIDFDSNGVPYLSTDELVFEKYNPNGTMDLYPSSDSEFVVRGLSPSGVVIYSKIKVNP